MCSENEVFRIKAKNDMINVLNALDRSEKDIEIYCRAFDYFVQFPKLFDGATIARDLYHVCYYVNGKKYKLSIDAMKHDWRYIVHLGNRDYKANYKWNKEYFNDMLRNGKGTRYLRFIGLVIVGPFYVFYTKKFNKRYKL